MCHLFIGSNEKLNNCAQMTNEEYGQLLAEYIHENGITYCPRVLNSEQANAFNKRYKQLNNGKVRFRTNSRKK